MLEVEFLQVFFVVLSRRCWVRFIWHFSRYLFSESYGMLC